MTAQLQLTENTGKQGVLDQARLLSGHVDAVTVPANPQGTVHMAGLAAASLLLDAGIDPVLNIASRDRNRIAIRSELLGAAAIGVTSLILQRGDKLSGRSTPKPRKRRKVGSVKLLRVARRLSEFQAQNNEPELYLGTVANVARPAPDWEPKVLFAKADAGAQFVQTKPCLDINRLRAYMSRLVATRLTHRCLLIVTVPVLDSSESAQGLNEVTRRKSVPDRLVRQLAGSEAPELLGIELAADFLRDLRKIPGVAGAHLVATGAVESVPAAIRAST